MTIRQKRARAFCEHIRDNSDFLTTINVDWARSRDWGLNPRIEYRGKKVAFASGCGYCKLSTVLAEALYFLGDTPEEELSIACCGGAGVSSLIDRLKTLGWELNPVASGKTYDCYTIRRISTTAS